MKNPLLLLLLLLLFAGNAFGQPPPGPVRLSRSEALAADAGVVFRTNKFLDFRGQDTLVQTIAQVVYAVTDLRRNYGTSKDWPKVEAEDTATYRRPVERYAATRYHYAYTDTSMTERYTSPGAQPNMHTAWTTVYNLQGFVTYAEKKTYIDDKLVVTKGTTNTFDRQNRVLRIAEKSVSSLKELNAASVIRAAYAGNTVTVTSDNGIMVCRLIPAKNFPQPVSELSARQTADAFMLALQRQQFALARTYCTPKMAGRVSAYATSNLLIESLAFQKGSARSTAGGVGIADSWKIKLTKQPAALYKVDFVLMKQANGWKIADFQMIHK